MQEKLKPEMLPDTVQKLLQEKECRFYLAFASGKSTAALWTEAVSK